jgi:hypothetical protein
MKKLRPTFILVILLLSACDKQVQAVPPTSIPATQTAVLTETAIPATETPTSILFTPTADPTIFGAIGTGEIQAYALESVASAIFNKTMDGFIVNGEIQKYQVTSVTIFPGSNGLLSEIIFNVKTNDPSWAADGGTLADDNWINSKCYRFDFFTTDTEYQLKNQRLCN